MNFKKIIPFVIAFFVISFSTNAQVTTSSISGVVKTGNTNALVGATIVATHLPTGTVYTAISRSGGRYDIGNMNTGGPYKVITSFSGFDVITKEDIYLTLGETQRIDFSLVNKTTDLTTVVVSTTKSNQSKTGTETTIGRDRLTNVPTVGRNLNDYIRFTPQAKITANGGISLGGQNNRYNSFLIDGAVNNDVFGLSDQGTNGGRAGTPPISIDAVDQLVVKVSDFDASAGNFTGGSINAITKSGSNTFHGSAYYIFRNQDLSGKTPAVADSLRTKLTNYSNKTYGFTIGGPIIKNKAFFFINAEKQDDSRPQPFTPQNILNANGTIRYNIVDSVKRITDHLKSTYGYDPGDYLNNADIIQRTNLNTRFDFNLSSKNKLTASYRYTKAERTNPGRSSQTSINFVNGAEYFPNVTHSGNIELNTKFNNKLNNKIRFSITDVNDDRDITGNPFPRVSIAAFNGGPSINFGSEPASSANLLKQQIFNIYDVAKYYIGKHSLSAGADLDFNKSYNLFINNSFGTYNYNFIGATPNQTNPLQAFLTNAGATGYTRGYSLVDPGNKAGDLNVNAAANFKSVRIGFFVNDDIKITNNFILTLGVRGDKTQFNTAVPLDTFFENRALPVIAANYDLKGARSGQKFQPSWQISPRLGFKYEIPEENLIVRGGIGVFTGRTPLVWPGGLYQNNGVTIGAVSQNSTSTTAGGVTTVTPVLFNGAPLPFRPDVANQYNQVDFGLSPTALTPQGDMNLIAKNFKLPSSYKIALGFDKKFNKGWTLSVDGLFTKNINEVDWRNVNIINPSTVLSGADNRTVYSTNGNLNTIKLSYRPGAVGSVQANPYNSVILIQNTDGKKGYAYNFTTSIDKQTKTGFSFNASYTYGNSLVNNEGTSSVNLSNWRFGAESVIGRNFVRLSTSDYDLKHRIFAYASKKFTYANKHMATTISLVYNGQSGNPYSYVYNGNNFVGDIASGNDLAYIPRNRAEIESMVFVTRLTGAAATPTANAADIAQQKDDFEAFIQNDKYLSKNRGGYAARNGARLPFTNILDAAIQQDFMVKSGKVNHTLSVRLDISNFTNLLNKNAGRQYFLTNDQFALLNFRGLTNTPATNTPTFQYFKPANKVGTISDGVNTFNSSRWNGQVTIRYTF
ncbi:carboxypeptidase regulatory-like domain-containing protein [Ferruginibacter yonginensis]|uniref:Carboxypeptidase regulatory-like domain-containing protein n=1 Tax=Ferruginibacter yonginensis TaxID=1310416 RepID=A0ABV8QNP3_9BACT